MFAGFFAKSQTINLEPNLISTHVASEWKFVKIYSNFITQNVPILQDSVMYSLFKVPEEIQEIGILDNTNYVIGDTLFKNTNNIRLDITYGRRLILYQLIQKYVYVEVEKPTEDKMFFYLKKAKVMGITNSQFYNYQPIKDIVNPTDPI